MEAPVELHCYDGSDYYGNYDYDNFIACYGKSDGDLEFNSWIELTK